MPYDPKTQAIVLISKKHRDKLKRLAKKNKRTMQGQLEWLIEESK